MFERAWMLLTEDWLTAGDLAAALGCSRPAAYALIRRAESVAGVEFVRCEVLVDAVRRGRRGPTAFAYHVEET